MTSTSLETCIAIYRIKANRMDDFMNLLRKHYPTLKGLGLVTDETPVVYVGQEKGGANQPIIFEIFTWVDGDAARVAHETPEVARIWEAMGTMVESRDGRPKFEFPHVRKTEMIWEA